MGPGGIRGQPIVPCGKRQVSAEEVLERDRRSHVKEG